MKSKKTWFSYLAWFIFAVYTGVVFAVYLSAFGANIWHLNKYGTAFLICAAFAGCGGIWFAGRKASEIAGRKVSLDDHLFKMWECFLVMCIFAGAVLQRIYLMFHYTGNVDGGIFYEMAAVKDISGIPEITHGASYIYTAVLSFVLSFIGNKAAAGVFLQMVLQVAAVMVFYFAVRLLTGKVEALCAAVILSFLPDISGQIFTFSPESLYFLLYAVGLLLLGCYAVKDMPGVLFALTGVYAGILGYLDIAGWTLLLFAVFIGIKKASNDDTTAVKDMILEIMVFLIAAVIGMALCIFADALLTGKAAESIISAWWEIYAPQGLQMPISLSGNLLQQIILCICAALGIIGFWFHKEQKQDAWILLLAAVTIFGIVNAGCMEYGMFDAAVWSVFAAMGIASIGTEKSRAESALLQDMIVEEITEEDDTETGRNTEAGRNAGAERSTGAEKNAEAESNIWVERNVESERSAEAENKAVIKDSLQEKPKVNYIENPLPLPKKHVKKEMDYDRTIEDISLDFDIAIGENDDFDI